MKFGVLGFSVWPDTSAQSQQKMDDIPSAATENVSLYLTLSMNYTFSTRNHVAALFGNDCLGCFDFYYNSGLSCLMTAIQDFFTPNPV